MHRPDTLRATVVAALALFLVPQVAFAHGVTGRDAAFVQSIDGAAIGPFLYLGAKHMVTGYDHLAFLIGVIFFLYRLKDVLLYVSLFTLGHSTTLLLGVLGGIHANAYIIDAIIGLSVAYKAFENMDGFERLGLSDREACCGNGVRAVPWLRPGDEAAGVHAVTERPGH